MNLAAALRKSFAASPILAAVAYAGLVFVLLVLVVTSVADILGQRAAVASSVALLEQLEGRRATASGVRPADVLMPSGSENSAAKRVISPANSSDGTANLNSPRATCPR